MGKSLIPRGYEPHLTLYQTQAAINADAKVAGTMKIMIPAGRVRKTFCDYNHDFAEKLSIIPDLFPSAASPFVHRPSDMVPSSPVRLRDFSR